MSSQIITHCVFGNLDDEPRCAPNILDADTVELTINETEGSLTFHGTFQIEDHAPPYPEDAALEEWERPIRSSRHLPIRLNFHMDRRDKEPYGSEPVDDSEFPPELRSRIDQEIGQGISRGWSRMLYHIYEEHLYLVEIYRRVVHEETEREMSRRGKRQTVYFRILETVR
jgi:hypothetical protein